MLSMIDSLPALVSLSLPYNGQAVTNKVVDKISQLNNLRTLDLTCAYMVTNFDKLFAMPTVIDLILNHCPEARLVRRMSRFI